MPIYSYREKKTRVMIDVIRKLKDADLLPTEEEVADLESVVREQLGDNRDWEKYIGKTNYKLGGSWGMGKGNW